MIVYTFESAPGVYWTVVRSAQDGAGPDCAYSTYDTAAEADAYAIAHFCANAHYGDVLCLYSGCKLTLADWGEHSLVPIL